RFAEAQNRERQTISIASGASLSRPVDPSPPSCVRKRRQVLEIPDSFGYAASPPFGATSHSAWTVTVPVVARNPWSDAFGLAADAVRTVAMKSLFDRLEAICEGSVAVNTDAKIIWINKKYAERLGLPDERVALGKDIEEVIPNSRM